MLVNVAIGQGEDTKGREIQVACHLKHETRKYFPG